MAMRSSSQQDRDQGYGLPPTEFTDLHIARVGWSLSGTVVASPRMIGARTRPAICSSWLIQPLLQVAQTALTVVWNGLLVWRYSLDRFSHPDPAAAGWPVRPMRSSQSGSTCSLVIVPLAPQKTQAVPDNGQGGLRDLQQRLDEPAGTDRRSCPCPDHPGRGHDRPGQGPADPGDVGAEDHAHGDALLLPAGPGPGLRSAAHGVHRPAPPEGPTAATRSRPGLAGALQRPAAPGIRAGHPSDRDGGSTGGASASSRLCVQRARGPGTPSGHPFHHAEPGPRPDHRAGTHPDMADTW